MNNVTIAFACLVGAAHGQRMPKWSVQPLVEGTPKQLTVLADLLLALDPAAAFMPSGLTFANMHPRRAQTVMQQYTGGYAAGDINDFMALIKSRSGQSRSPAPSPMARPSTSSQAGSHTGGYAEGSIDDFMALIKRNAAKKGLEIGQSRSPAPSPTAPSPMARPSTSSQAGSHTGGYVEGSIDD